MRQAERSASLLRLRQIGRHMRKGMNHITKMNHQIRIFRRDELNGIAGPAICLFINRIGR